MGLGVKARRYSLIDLAESMKPGGDIRTGKFERNISSMMLEVMPTHHGRMGCAIPSEEFARDLEIGAANTGGNLVGTDVLVVAKAARPRLVLEEAGCQVRTVNDVGEVHLPVFDGSLATSTWIAEGAASPSFTALEVRAVTMAGKQCSSRIAYSRRVAVGAPDRRAFEGALLAELRAAVQHQIEAGLLVGTGGSGQPTGLANTPGRGSVTYAGSTPTYGELMTQVATYADADGPLGTAAFFCHPSDLTALLNTQVTAGGGRTAVEYVNGAYRCVGIPFHASTAQTEGTITLTDTSRVQIVYFGPPTVITDPFSAGKSKHGTTEVHLHNFVDVAVADASLVVVGSS